MSSSILRPQRGFSFIELLVVLAIGAAITLLVLTQAGSVTDTDQLQRIAKEIEIIGNAAQKYKANKTSYFGLSSSKIISQGLLPEGMINSGGYIFSIYDGPDITRHAYLVSSYLPKGFTITKVNTSGAPFDIQQLNYWDNYFRNYTICSDNNGIPDCSSAPTRDGNQQFFHILFN